MAPPADFEDFFTREDSRFLNALRAVQDPSVLAAFTERWKTDQRPWSREQMFRYVALPWNCPLHQPVLKRLFKHADVNGDDELMAVFCVALDRLVRRKKYQRWRWDWQNQTSFQTFELGTPANSVIPTTAGGPRYRNPRTGEPIGPAVSFPPAARLFSYHTRYYLRRRAWRYFRWMGFQRPQQYCIGIARALILYRDEDLQAGENLLDSWSFMNCCFYEAEALEFGGTHVKVKEGKTLAELSPAPRFPHLWQSQDGFEVLLLVLAEARARAVRTWAMELLRRDHVEHLKNIPAETILELLAHTDPEVQQFAAALFEKAEGLQSLPLDVWMKLLDTDDLTTLETICRAMEQHVRSERLTLADCVRLACAEPTPVARIGVRYLQDRKIEDDESRQAITQLAESRCPAIAEEATTWALKILGNAGVYDCELVLPFFDSLSHPIRKAAWDWLLAESETSNQSAYGDPVLWSRLLETPFDDVRLRLIEELENRSARPHPRPGDDELTPVWCSVLLGVHRGGRQKAKAVGQITRAIEKQPSRAETLLPILTVALRSIRRPEMRAALSAVATLVHQNPELETQVAAQIPELQLHAVSE